MRRKLDRALTKFVGQVVADLTTKLQRDVLNVLFEGEEAARPKYSIFASDALEPRYIYRFIYVYIYTYVCL